eukprot:gene17307-11162_t
MRPWASALCGVAVLLLTSALSTNWGRFIIAEQAPPLPRQTAAADAVRAAPAADGSDAAAGGCGARPRWPCGLIINHSEPAVFAGGAPGAFAGDWPPTPPPLRAPADRVPSLLCALRNVPYECEHVGRRVAIPAVQERRVRAYVAVLAASMRAFAPSTPLVVAVPAPLGGSPASLQSALPGITGLARDRLFAAVLHSAPRVGGAGGGATPPPGAAAAADGGGREPCLL